MSGNIHVKLSDLQNPRVICCEKLVGLMGTVKQNLKRERPKTNNISVKTAADIIAELNDRSCERLN